ncbi:hypothetical protein E4T50_12772 [Aureobasidium sp. EXF-12298]|nr:hypothetical protein E4T50_12772 [Aureobasidium sp. EXF-12298]
MDFGAGSGLTSLFKIGRTVYELVAVTEQTHNLLDSANHVSSSVETVRSLRRQKSGLLQAEEKKWMDRVISDTEKTLNSVASLVEPARVDIQTNFGKIGLVNRALSHYAELEGEHSSQSNSSLSRQRLFAFWNRHPESGGYKTTTIVPRERVPESKTVVEIQSIFQQSTREPLTKDHVGASANTSGL